MITRIILFCFQSAALYIVVAGLVSFPGCRSQHSTVRGIAPTGPIVAVRDLKDTGKPVVLQGTMVEKCPVAGCWFMLRDKTGVIKVDTKGAGFVVTDVPLNIRVTVSGVLKTSGERLLAANGMRF